jgi:AcrR family transcriptional regulator
VQAARELIVERGDTGLSMRELARRAGVSQATPYNLFGTKRAILLGVLQDVEDFGGRMAARASHDALGRIFDLVEIMADMYAADPAFYRILWQYLFDARGNAEIRGDFALARRAAFRFLVNQAHDEGVLDPRLSRRLLAAQLEQALFGTASAWLFGYLEPGQLKPTLGTATGLVMAGAVTNGVRPDVVDRVLQYQAMLTPPLRPAP